MTRNSKSFQIEVTHDNYILRDHTVHGVGIMPGVVCLDLVYRAAIASGLKPGEIELRQILFENPITARLGEERAIEVQLEEDVSHWDVRLRGRSKDPADEHGWVEHLRCKIATACPASSAGLPIEELKSAAARTFDLEQIYAGARSLEIRHQSFMKAHGLVYVGDDFLGAEVRLSPLAQQYLAKFHIHAVFLDCATLLAFGPAAESVASGAARPFIPIYIERFRALRQPGESCFVYVRKAAVVQPSEEIAYSDVELYSLRGELCAQFHRLGVKQVRSPELIRRLTNGSGNGHAIPAALPNPVVAGSDTAETHDAVTERLREIVAAATGNPLASIQPDRGLFEQGLSSTDLLQAVREIERVGGVELYPTLLFEHATLSALAKHFAEREPRVAEALKQQVKDPAVISVPPVQKVSADDIAVIGMSGRFPLAANLEEFWDNLTRGRDCIVEIPRERWDYRQYYSADVQAEGKLYSKWGGFVDHFDCFDPMLFGISPFEAETMDPQERLFMEAAWATLEDAGYTRQGLGSDVGVFVGAMWSDYQLYGVEEWLKGANPAANSWFSAIPNRVSYVLNFTGPSIPVDTACSSSLTAVHLACESIRRGECSVALAGGVNLSLHPTKYVKLCRFQMLAPDGRCRSFGKDASGYVPGEGVGALLLKPLRAAIADGDHVYGVIKATAINHGGKGSGYAVPNLALQTQLIAATLAKSGINPRTISSIEAHGTGTSLGDPIEVEALTRAFRAFTTDTGFCSLGSVKSNIGHLEAASGIAGLIKVLLQLQHRALLPTLHSEEPNPKIHFADSPFYLQHRCEPWQRPVVTEDGAAVTYPRRAGLSSFGAGGVNVHVLVEEFETDAPGPDNGPELILLSARDDERLRELAARVREYLPQHPELRLTDVAFTLRNGREPLAQRLAFVAADIAGLLAGLDRFLAGDPTGLFTGRVKSSKNAVTANVDAVRKMAAQGDRNGLAAHWASGVSINWDGVPGYDRGRRVSLPAYPFARKRYWLTSRSVTSTGAGPRLHPLLDANDSTFEEQVYHKLLSPSDFYLADHVIGGRKVLPGVVYLEMARAAVEHALGKPVYELQSIVWIRPMALNGESKQAHITLSPAGEQIHFQVWTGDPSQRVIHAQGQCPNSSFASERPLWPLEEIRARCRNSRPSEAVYGIFQAAGLEYGPSFRVVEEMWQGEGEALARLRLSAAAAAVSGFTLHPAILDGALQTIVGAVGNANGGFLPFEVGRVRFSEPLPPVCWAHVQRLEANGGVLAFSLVLFDDAGRELASLENLRLRAMPGGRDAVPEQKTEVLFYRPLWQSRALPPALPDSRALLLVNGSASLATALGPRVQLAGVEDCSHTWKRLAAGALVPPSVLLSLDQPSQTGDANAIHSVAVVVRALMSAKPAQPVSLICFSESGAEEHPSIASVAGFLRSVRMENPRILGKLVFVTPGEDLAACLLAEVSASEDAEVSYCRGARSVRSVESAVPSSTELPFKHHGAYLITGGAGGLGSIFARYFAEKFHSRLLLCGRAEPDSHLDGILAELNAAGGQAFYLACDVTRQADVERAVREMHVRFGTLHGVIHSAGLIEDGFLEQKTPESFARVIAPKVLGAVFLDQVSVDEPLDFFALFSSISGVTGNIGQSDYAAANRFLDAFAVHREALRRQGARQGRTLSINWPLWRNGGMHMLPQVEQVMERAVGLVPMSTSDGLAAWETCWRMDGPQILVLHGHRARIESHLQAALAARSDAAPTLSNTAPAASDDELVQKITSELLHITAEVLKIDPNEINTDQDLSEYGFDSIALTKLAERMNERFHLDLTPTRFYEYPSGSEFARFLATHYRSEFESAFGRSTRPAAALDTPTAVPDTDPKARILAALTSTAGEVLKLSDQEIDLTQDLSELGFDSIAITQFTNRLNERFRLELTPVQLYEYPSADALAGFLLENFRDRFAEAAAEPKPMPATPALVETPAALPKARKTVASSRAVSTPHARNQEYPPVAIIGVSGMFPQSPSIQAFWKHLADGANLITEIPPERFDWRLFYGDAQKGENKSDSKWGGFMPAVDLFDARFFNISPAEAELMDPQQRLFLQTAWSAIEDAGYRPSAIERFGRTGLFVGLATSDYSELVFRTTSHIGAYTSTGSAHSVLPNRISYLLNLSGPSEPVDTACSSSLVAIHRAIKSIHDGDCDLAIAGGVNVLLSPSAFIAFSKAGMLSRSGRCAAFGAGADGYVRGEGCAAVLLKPLDRAEADGDFIYGVILGSAVNHGGRARSLTAPNPQAQAALLQKAWQRAGIRPDSISYIEAHGTGTSLGDPIEMSGLRMALEEEAARQGIKLTEGSCSVGSVKSNIGHLETASGMAGLTKVLMAMRHGLLPASLYTQELNPYLKLDGGPLHVMQTSRPWQPASGLPRRAGISSFGFGGANAHIVVEEYQRGAQTETDKGSPQLIVLSAKSPERLQAYAQELRDAVADPAHRFRLSDLAYTLQTGRDPMPYRLALEAADCGDLARKLGKFLGGEIPSDCAVVKESKDLLGSGPDAQAYLAYQFQHKNWSRLARLWLEGIEIRWAHAWEGGGLRRVPVPTYPFAPDRHWFPASPDQLLNGWIQISEAPKLHPLLDRNESTIERQTFRTTLLGTEWYLKDHVLQGRMVLPAAATLEMARAAADFSGVRPVRLQKVVWSRPIIFDGAKVDLQTDLQADSNGGEFEILAGDDVYTQGRFAFDLTGSPRQFSLEEVRARCSRRMAADALYETFRRNGLVYGPGFCVIEQLESGAGEALAHLRLPAVLEGKAAEYGMHPALLDGAFQALAGIEIGNDGDAWLPFAVEEITIFGPLPSRCYSHARLLESNQHIAKASLTVMAEDGREILGIREFSLKRIATAAESPAAKLLFFESYWEDAPQAASDPPPIVYRTGAVEAGEDEGEYCIRELSKVLGEARAWIDAARSNPRVEVVNQSVSATSRLTTAALAGFGRALSVEDPRISCTAAGHDGIRKVLRVREAVVNGESATPFERAGAYLITGGMGGLGFATARHLIANYDASIVAVGRSPHGSEEIAQLGGNIHYIQADLSDRAQTLHAVDQARSRLGRIDGVFHCAGVIRDALIRSKTEAAFQEVLRPKILGALHLDEATKDDRLQVFVLYSSLAGITGNAGQCDYAAANAFLDEFAEYREGLRLQGQRNGRTVSIAWPLWKEGGMRVSAEIGSLIEKHTGMRPLETSEGLKALEDCLRSSSPRMIVAAGDRRPIRSFLKVETASAGAAPIPQEDLTDTVRNKLLAMAAEMLKVDPSTIELKQDLSEYGFDSIALTQLANRLNEEWDIDITPADFFTHPSANDFAAFLAKQYGGKLSKLLRSGPVEIEALSPAVENRARRVRFRKHVSRTENPEYEPIAVIGMSGIFPQSPDIRAFWNHLAAGDNLVTQIPRDRFDWRLFAGESARNGNRIESRWGGFMPRIDCFDAEFFGISPREAALMDPQQRLFLETAWKTIEDAGYAPGSLSGSRTGLFVGVATNDYAELLGHEVTEVDALMSTGSAHCVLTNRISYLLNLSGPSEPVDTACSSSLVAVHRAIQSIHDGDCDLAIAGGVNVLLSPSPFIAFSKAGMLSPQGRCATFGANADGYVRGEGSGAVFLKPLRRAIADGDPIYGVIRGSAVNHGGRARSLTAPNPQAQADLLMKAWERGGVSPETLSYIEAHGTGTTLGDPIEVNGLRMALQEAAASRGIRLPESSCGLGSVKSNIGHLETAAGIAGLVKVLMAMRYGILPASLHCAELNPYLKLEGGPLYVIQKSQAWRPLDGGLRRAGISSFGFGGANAHIVVEEFHRDEELEAEGRSPHLFVLSAKSQNRLQACGQALREFVADPVHPFRLGDLAYTLQTGRDSMPFRLAFEATSRGELLSKLEDPFVAAKAERNPLALKWMAGEAVDWRGFHAEGTWKRVPAPTYPFQQTRHWALRSPSAAEVSASLERKSEEGQTSEISDALRKALAEVLGLPAEKIEPQLQLHDLGLTSIMAMGLLDRVEAAAGIRIYPNELAALTTVGEVVAYIQRERQRQQDHTRHSEKAAPASAVPDAKPFGGSLVFLLSAPRSGSTLLRAMLAGHSRLFAPPELHLLGFESLKDRAQKLSGSYLTEGLIQAFGALESLEAGAAADLVRQMEEEDWAIPRVYESLLNLAEGRILVDKSPSYARDLETLRLAEGLGEPRYILLFRHPKAVMESFVRNRFDRLIPADSSDPWKLAEQVWRSMNLNLIHFAAELPAHRVLKVQYESLVRNPEPELRRICAFLGVEFEPSVLRPYDGERLTGGLHANSLSIGDPNFRKHEALDTALADNWCDRFPPDVTLAQDTVRVACTLEYRPDADRQIALSGSQRLIVKQYREDPWILSHRLRLNGIGDLNSARVEVAFQTVINQHWALRTYFAGGEGSLVQREAVAPRVRVELAGNKEIAIAARLWPQFQATVIETDPGAYEFVWASNHLIGDGISSHILAKSLVDILSDRSPAEPADYFEYRRAIAELESPENLKADLSDYRSLIANSAFALPVDNSAGDNLGGSEAELVLACPYPAVLDLPRLATALYRVISEWSGNPAPVIAHRLHRRRVRGRNFGGVFGCLAGDVPISLSADAGPEQLRSTLKAIPEHGITYDLLALAGDLPLPWEAAPVRLNFQPPIGEMNLSVTQRPPAAGNRGYLLDLIVRPGERELTLIARYSRSIYRQDTIEKILKLWCERLSEPIEPQP
jgi:acyl transferase domain-containing protein